MTEYTVLLVDDDETECAMLEGRLSMSGFRVETVGTVPAALRWLAVNRPAAIVCDYLLTGRDGLALLREVRALEESTDIAFVLLTSLGNPALRSAAWKQGADAVFDKPVHVGELTNCLNAQIERRREAQALEAHQLAAERSVQQATTLLIELLDAMVPGSEHRGRELAAATASLAAEFDIPSPAMWELELAARLHELGSVTLRAVDQPAPCDGPGPSSRLTGASAALLRQLDWMHNVADLIEGMGAHWDGTGHPTGLQRGQIPLRSRLLRTVADLLATARNLKHPGPAALTQAAELLGTHAGTLYDPAVLAALSRMLSRQALGPWRTADMHVAMVDELKVGMVLAGDMFTASGVKLLAKGTVLSDATLQLVLQRHEIDPIVHGVPIRTGRRGPIANRSITSLA